MNTDISFYSGNGEPGGPNGNAADRTEKYIHEEAVAFDQRLTDLRIPHYFDDYGPGDHTDFYMMGQDFVRWLPRLTDYFEGKRRPMFNGTQTVVSSGHDGDRPRSFVYSAIAPEYDSYGWNVAIQRPALEFSALEVSGKKLDIVGGGTATIKTPANYVPGKKYKLKIDSILTGRSNQTATANAQGQLEFSVQIGPGNPNQQFTSESKAAASGPSTSDIAPPFPVEDGDSNFYRVSVQIS